MSALEIWVAICGLTLVTIATRAGYLLIARHRGLPEWLERGLRYAPACALAAIIAPDLLATSPAIDAPLVLHHPRLLGMLAGVGSFLVTKTRRGKPLA
jgi:branched-subunit amino acid transport protein